MNKKQTGIYERWLASNNLNLYDCYKKPSESKLDAEWRIIHACRQMHGKRFRILSYNTFTFTCAYAVEKDDKTMLIWHSPYNTEVFEIPSPEKDVI